MGKAILEVRDVSFRYRLSRNEYSETVLNKVSLTVPEGEILVLIGPSGSGKTTLLRLLNRLEDPEEGVVLYSGNDVEDTLPSETAQGGLSGSSGTLPGGRDGSGQFTPSLEWPEGGLPFGSKDRCSSGFGRAAK